MISADFTSFSYLFRLISDTVSVSVLSTVGLYHLLTYFVRRRAEERKPDLFFFLFLMSLVLYVFFDNTLARLFFTGEQSPQILTTGLSISTLSGMSFFLLFFHQIMRIKKRLILVISITLFFIISLIPLIIWVIGYDKYISSGLDRFTIMLYILIFLGDSIFFILELAKRNLYQDRILRFIYIISSIIFPSFFIFQFVLAANWNDSFLHNHLILILVVLCYPILLVTESRKELSELTLLKERLKTNWFPEAPFSQRSLDYYAETKGFSSREKEVFHNLLKGLEYKEISSELNLSLGGVKKRVHSLYRKAEVQNRTELVNSVLETPFEG